MKHDFKKIEPKWQKKWDEAGIFQAVDNDERPKFYGLVEFPYPSGAVCTSATSRRTQPGSHFEKAQDGGI